MRKKTIEKNLRKALLEDGPFARTLFEFELEEHIDEYMRSRQADGDDYFIAVTEHTNDVAMLLIDQDDKVHINEAARALLKKFWKDNYRRNLRRMIPDMARELDNGYLYVMGVRTTSDKV